MKKLKSVMFKFFLTVTLFMSFQTVFATDKTVIIIRKDDFPDPAPYQPCRMTTIVPVSVSMNDNEMSVYSGTTLGVANIIVTDDSVQAVY